MYIKSFASLVEQDFVSVEFNTTLVCHVCFIVSRNEEYAHSIRYRVKRLFQYQTYLINYNKTNFKKLCPNKVQQRTMHNTHGTKDSLNTTRCV